MTNYFKYPTTNHEVLKLKKQLKFNQARIKRISKLVKFNLEFYFECYQCEFCGKYSVNGWN